MDAQKLLMTPESVPQPPAASVLYDALNALGNKYEIRAPLTSTQLLKYGFRPSSPTLAPSSPPRDVEAEAPKNFDDRESKVPSTVDEDGTAVVEQVFGSLPGADSSVEDGIGNKEGSAAPNTSRTSISSGSNSSSIVKESQPMEHLSAEEPTELEVGATSVTATAELGATGGRESPEQLNDASDDSCGSSESDSVCGSQCEEEVEDDNAHATNSSDGDDASLGKAPRILLAAGIVDDEEGWPWPSDKEDVIESNAAKSEEAASDIGSSYPFLVIDEKSSSFESSGKNARISSQTVMMPPMQPMLESSVSKEPSQPQPPPQPILNTSSWTPDWSPMSFLPWPLASGAEAPSIPEEELQVQSGPAAVVLAPDYFCSSTSAQEVEVAQQAPCTNRSPSTAAFELFGMMPTLPPLQAPLVGPPLQSRIQSSAADEDDVPFGLFF